MHNRKTPTLPTIIDDPENLTRGFDRLGIGWIAVADAARAVGWNRVAERVVGLPATADPVVDVAACFLHTDAGKPCHAPEDCPALTTSRAADAPETVEDVRRSDGTTVTIRYVVETSKSPYLAATIFLQSMATIRMLDEELEEEAAFRRLLTSATEDILAMVDEEGTILSLHSALLGPESQVALGTRAYDYMPTAEHSTFRHALATVFDGAREAEFETRAPGVDGGLRHYACSVRPLNVDGRPSAAVILARDITERRRLEDEVRSLHAELRALDKA